LAAFFFAIRASPPFRSFCRVRKPGPRARLGHLGYFFFAVFFAAFFIGFFAAMTQLTSSHLPPLLRQRSFGPSQYPIASRRR
jgi:hypothetical protein